MSNLELEIYRKAREERRPLTQEEVDKIRELRRKRQLEYWKNLNCKFTVDKLDHIPEPPVVCPEVYKDIIIPAFIRCGAIPKSQLEVGATYEGSCRNAHEAVWDGFQFEYTRYKFGSSFKEKINHFEDDNGYDLFVPIKKCEKSQEL